MDKSDPTAAQQIAQAAVAFEIQRTGHGPASVTVALSDEAWVITLHGVFSEAEKALAKTPKGAAQLQEFHRQLFAGTSDSLRQDVERIAGVEVREATAEVGTTAGTLVLVFLLAGRVETEVWTEGRPGGGE